MNIIQRIIINTVSQILGRAYFFTLSFCSIILLTRYLGVSGYGNYSLVFSYLSIFGLLADMGLSLLLVREIAKNKIKIEKYISILIFIKILLILISIILSISIATFFPYTTEIKKAIFIGSFAIGIGSLTSFGLSFYQGKLRMDVVTIIDQATKSIIVFFMLLFILLKLNFLFIILSVLIGNIIGFLIMLFLIKNEFNLTLNFQIITSKFIKAEKKIVKDSFFIGIMTLFAFTYFKIDSILLSIYKSPVDLGIYSLAYKVIENILLIWGYYMATIFPLFSKYTNNKHKYLKLFHNSFRISIIISAILILLVFTQSSLIINILGGQIFFKSIYPLKILIFSIPFFLINNIFYNSLISNNMIKHVIICLLFSLLFNILFNIILIPKFSYIASSYITLFTEIFLFIEYLIIYNIKFRLSYAGK